MKIRSRDVHVWVYYPRLRQPLLYSYNEGKVQTSLIVYIDVG